MVRILYPDLEEVSMRLSLILAVVAALSQPVTVPDMNGEWKMVPDRSGSPTQSVPVTEMTFVIAQTGDQVRLDMTSGGKPTVSVTYPIVAAPKQPAEPLGNGQQRAYWDGNRLIVERGGAISGQTVSVKQSMTLSPDQSELIVERIVTVQHGYTLKGTPNFGTVKDVFARVPRP
jgi:hypothetical protein